MAPEWANPSLREVRRVPWGRETFRHEVPIVQYRVRAEDDPVTMVARCESRRPSTRPLETAGMCSCGLYTVIWLAPGKED